MVEAVAAAADAAGGRRAPRGDARRRHRERRARALARRRGRPRAASPSRCFRPVQPMLAQPADDIADALARLGTAALEWKLDGARVQVHKAGDEVRVYTRTGNDVTAAVPEIVEAIRDAPRDDADPRRRGDRARTPTARRYPFQVTMRRFGRTLDVEAMRAELPLVGVLLRLPALRRRRTCSTGPRSERFDALAARAAVAQLVIPRLVTGDVAAAAGVLRRRARARPRGRDGQGARRALRAGPRAARSGSRSSARTRSTSSCSPPSGATAGGKGWLSNLHLGARDPATGELRHARQDLQGHDRRDARVADGGAADARGRARRRPCTCAPSSSSRSRSTTCRRARAIPAASRCASRASRATARQAGAGSRHDRDRARDLRRPESLIGRASPSDQNTRELCPTGSAPCA